MKKQTAQSSLPAGAPGTARRGSQVTLAEQRSALHKILLGVAISLALCSTTFAGGLTLWYQQPAKTPKLAAAAKVSLDARGIAPGSDMREWSFAWRAALYARLHDPEQVAFS